MKLIEWNNFSSTLVSHFNWNSYKKQPLQHSICNELYIYYEVPLFEHKNHSSSGQQLNEAWTLIFWWWPLCFLPLMTFKWLQQWGDQTVFHTCDLVFVQLVKSIHQYFRFFEKKSCQFREFRACAHLKWKVW